MQLNYYHKGDEKYNQDSYYELLVFIQNHNLCRFVNDALQKF